jgi:hypothetical protein
MHDEIGLVRLDKRVRLVGDFVVGSRSGFGRDDDGDEGAVGGIEGGGKGVGDFPGGVLGDVEERLRAVVSGAVVERWGRGRTPKPVTRTFV